MKRKRYSTEQIVAAIKRIELGTPAADIFDDIERFYNKLMRRRLQKLEPSEITLNSTVRGNGA